MALDSSVLKTGNAGAERLNLLDDIYGYATWATLSDAGLRSGMRVLDVGCGTGTITRFVAELVGRQGLAVGLDRSSDQVQTARDRHANVPNLEFVTADASRTGLPEESFDLIYCRMLLMHVPDPLETLREFARLVRHGGIVACEELTMDTAHFEPPVPAGERLVSLGGTLGAGQNGDFNLGRRLPLLFRQAGFEKLEMRDRQPVFLRGPGKRRLEMSVAEAVPHLIDLGLATREEIEELLSAIREAAADESFLLRVARMSQVWGYRSR
jgi:SAM-dependent methyltransferase